MKRDFSTTNIISAACEYMNKHWLVFIAITVVSGVITSALSGSSTINLNNIDTNNIQSFLQELQKSMNSPLAYLGRLIDMLFTAVLLKMAYNAIDGKKVDFDAFKMPVMNYVNYVAAGILVGFIAGIGCLFCLLPGIFLAVRLQFASYYTIDRSLNVIDAIKASWHDTKGNFWHLLGADILIGLFMIAGVLLCCVGMFYTVPVAYIAFAILSRVFTESSDFTPESEAVAPTAPVAPQAPAFQQQEEATKMNDQAGYTKNY